VSILDSAWRTSTRSGTNGACVEVRLASGSVQVRDTKDRSGPVLSFPASAWQGFITGVHNGEFDRD
jgi:hypothetical protein